MLPESELRRGRDFVSYDSFYGYSETLEHRKTRLKLNRISIVADIIKERATHSDITFRDLIQAELVVFLVMLLSTDHRWYPNTLAYAESYSRFPFFVRAAQHKYFERLRIITGVETGDELRKKFAEGCLRCGIRNWHIFFHIFFSLEEIMNINALDTIT